MGQDHRKDRNDRWSDHHGHMRLSEGQKCGGGPAASFLRRKDGKITVVNDTVSVAEFRRNSGRRSASVLRFNRISDWEISYDGNRTERGENPKAKREDHGGIAYEKQRTGRH